MSRKLFLGTVLLLSGACFVSTAQAACDAQCQLNAIDVGQEAAQKVMFQEFQQGGRLGQLIRAEAGLELCGAKGKSDAILKLRRARFKEIVSRRVKEGPIGSAQTSEEQYNTQFASFLSTAQALQLGYALGYKEMATSALDTNVPTKNAVCRAYDKAADTVLFGES